MKTLIFAFVLISATTLTSVVSAGTFPSIDKIKADLIGRNFCNWEFDSISEYRKLDIVDMLTSSEIVEYDLNIEVQRGTDEPFILDRVITARAIYKKHQGEWVLAIFKQKECRSPAEDARKKPSELFEIVVSRMDEIKEVKRQLEISIFLLNKSSLPQVYPNIEIELKTRDGITVSQRIVEAEEYSTSHDRLISENTVDSEVVKRLIKPNKLGKVLITFHQPPVDAVGFSAKVVP